MFKVGIRSMNAFLIIIIITAVCSLYHEAHTRYDGFNLYVDFKDHSELVQSRLTNLNVFSLLYDYLDIRAKLAAPKLNGSDPLDVHGVIGQLKGTNWKLDIEPKFNEHELFHGKIKVGTLKWVEPPGFRPQYSTVGHMGVSDTFTFQPKFQGGALKEMKWTLKPGGNLKILRLKLSSDPPTNDAECPLSVIQERSPTVRYAGVYMQLALFSTDRKLKYLTENIKVYNDKDELEETIQFQGIIVFSQGEKKATRKEKEKVKKKKGTSEGKKGSEGKEGTARINALTERD